MPAQLARCQHSLLLQIDLCDLCCLFSALARFEGRELPKLLYPCTRWYVELPRTTGTVGPVRCLGQSLNQVDNVHDCQLRQEACF